MQLYSACVKHQMIQDFEYVVWRCHPLRIEMKVWSNIYTRLVHCKNKFVVLTRLFVNWAVASLNKSQLIHLPSSVLE